MTHAPTMSGVQLVRHGGPEALVWREDIPVPHPGPGEVLVRVLAAGVNATDINTRVGWYGKGEEAGWSGAIAFPRIQGSDLCGRVVALGEGVEGIAMGARVICPTNQSEPTVENPVHFVAIGSEYDGAFAQFCVVPARHLHDVTASPLSDVEIGAMPCAYGTANNLLHRAGVQAGERVLVTGASGGVGLAAVQLAVLRGAEVVGQCSPAKAGAVRQAGAEVLDRDAKPSPRSFHAVIDLVGGPGWADRLDALKPGGRYATSGAVGGPLVTGDLRTIYLNDLTIFGATNQPRDVFARLVELINGARVRPVVSRTYPLRDIAGAQADLAANRYPGKLVLIPPETLE
ncbi:zinc-binding dehydrogenase [Tabrizicola sp. J26]|uniref:alcohol dehydrogenase catalytic domain-containing protein n=1 Tax=Alitabrizicola rongguiensis TaxID=2909234 RepID=UPI001F3F6128|nr:zinc-binding dehydrogenase [Tabrizicola rongguiensis]MCF1708490.1 zinc-binding dehydrogenase [Tabrizicola rongguiensis]